MHVPGNGKYSLLFGFCCSHIIQSKVVFFHIKYKNLHCIYLIDYRFCKTDRSILSIDYDLDMDTIDEESASATPTGSGQKYITKNSLFERTCVVLL